MRCILVYGLESSGTSCVAGVLHNLGVYMGDRFPSASNTNLKGYYEDLTFVRRLEDLYSRDRWQDSVREWIESRADRELWGLKNPFLRTVSDKVIATFEKDFPDIEVKVIYVVRDVANIVKSQAWKRPNSDLQSIRCNVMSNQVQLGMVIEKLKLKHETLTVNYDDMIDNTKYTIQGLADFCFRGGYEKYLQEDGFDKAMEFVDPAMRRFS